MTIDEICAWLNAEYPGRDWDQQCQRLVWNVVWKLSGYLESSMHTYATATDARLASKIESTNPTTAPSGAIHYWEYPAEGHVGISLGGSKVLMTGTGYALGAGGVLKGNNYGITTVEAYSQRKGNRYLGWARYNGKNSSIIGKIKDNTPTSSAGQNGDDMLVWVQGKANARRGGLYFVTGGKATFLGSAKPAGVTVLTDDAQIKALQGRVSGLA